VPVILDPLTYAVLPLAILAAVALASLVYVPVTPNIYTPFLILAAVKSASPEMVYVPVI